MNQTTNPVAIKSKEAIINAFIETMKVTPYNEITVKTILVEAKVTRRTFYRNFNNMEDLLHSSVETVSHELFEVLQNKEYLKSPRLLSKAILEIVSKNEELFSVIAANKLESIFFHHMNTNIIKSRMVSLGISKDLTDYEVPIEDYKAVFNMGGILNVILTWLHCGRKESLETLLNDIAGITTW